MNRVIQLVIEQIFNAFTYIPRGCVWAVCITTVVFVSGILWKFCLHKSIKWTFWCRLFPFFIFIIYVYCLLQVTILSREQGNFGGIDWRIFARWSENDSEKAFVIMNILMFIPFGILFPMFGKWAGHILISWPIATMCSIGIEMTQLKYQIGACQFEDIVTNSSGFLIGFLGYLMMLDVYLVMRGIIRIFLTYFYDDDHS